MNTGRLLVRGDLNTTWIYVSGPVLDALIGDKFEWILKGEPTAAGTQGSLGTDDCAKPHV